MGNDKRGVGSFDPPPGLIRTGTIIGYDASTNMLQVRLTENPAIKGKPLSIPVPAYFPHADSQGLFLGSLPAKGTTITVAQSSGGQYYVVNHQPENLNTIPSLSHGEMLMQTSNNSFLSMGMDSHIYLGSDTNNIHVFPGSQQFPKSNLMTVNFENENHFTQAYREVGGLVKRDLRPNPQGASFNGDTKLEDDNYWISGTTQFIGMDPSATANDLIVGPTKNPPFVEHRKMVYEFQYNSTIEDDITESNKYAKTTQSATIYTTQNRRSSRADTMSLSLVAPNFLIEEVQGTVIDVFGNILDINRGALPVGLSATTTLRTNGTTASTDPQQSFITIKALERKSISYHFEINARKDPSPPITGVDLSINADNYNAKLQRSRFSFDVDKEGQFKLNVPASSEVGNVPLLVRAENYSTFSTNDSSNPNQTWVVQSPSNTSQDIYVDSFAAPAITVNDTGVPTFSQSFIHGSVQLVDGSSGADQGPVDRISQFVNNSPINIKHGTVYHDILSTGYLLRSSQSLSYPTGATNNVSVDYINSDMPTQAAPASSKVTVSGTNANAGGRSGSMNLDGSLEVNIGANTVDRQSLWMDTAGGAVVNLGRDKQQRSLVLGMDGHAFIQVGGYGVQVSDARFTALGQDGLINGILDIRVYNGGFTHIIRVDSQGIVIMSPGRIGIHSEQALTLSCDGNIDIDCENLTVQGRLVNKILGGSI
jgi:hypothetical protein